MLRPFLSKLMLLVGRSQVGGASPALLGDSLVMVDGEEGLFGAVKAVRGRGSS